MYIRHCIAGLCSAKKHTFGGDFDFVLLFLFFIFSMVEITQTTFNLGDTLNLRLMRREKDSVLATPVESTMYASPPATFLSVSENSNNEIYSKLLIASVQDVSS